MFRNLFISVRMDYFEKTRKAKGSQWDGVK